MKCLYKEKKLDLLALSSVPLVMTLGNSMLIPVLPQLASQLNISAFHVSLIITVYSIVAILLIPVAGYLSDRFGRKNVLVPCLIIAGIGGAISAFASWKLDDPFNMIIVGRVLQGVGSAGSFPIVLPLVGDMFKKDTDVSAALGLTETSNTAGKVLSPIVGALLASFLWYLPFVFIPIFCLISVLLVLFLVKTPKKQVGEKPAFKEFLAGVKSTYRKNNKWLNSIFIVGCLIMFVLFGILFYLSDILEKDYNIDGVYKGSLLAIPLLALSLCSYVAGKKIGQNKNAMKNITVIGMALLAGSFVLLRFQHSFIFLLSLLIFSGIGIGIALPCLDALITAGIEKEERGTITSLYSSMRFVGVASGPPIYAYIMSVSEHLVYYVSGAASILALLIVMLFIKPEKEKKKNQIKRVPRLV